MSCTCPSHTEHMNTHARANTHADAHSHTWIHAHKNAYTCMCTHLQVRTQNHIWTYTDTHPHKHTCANGDTIIPARQMTVVKAQWTLVRQESKMFLHTIFKKKNWNKISIKRKVGEFAKEKATSKRVMSLHGFAIYSNITKPKSQTPRLRSWQQKKRSYKELVFASRRRLQHFHSHLLEWTKEKPRILRESVHIVRRPSMTHERKQKRFYLQAHDSTDISRRFSTLSEPRSSARIIARPDSRLGVQHGWAEALGFPSR